MLDRVPVGSLEAKGDIEVTSVLLMRTRSYGISVIWGITDSGFLRASGRLY